MIISLPIGWMNFNGGGADPTLCGEDGSGTIPILTVTKNPQNLDCAAPVPVLSVIVGAVGGTPPFVFETTEGTIVELDARNAQLNIDSAVDLIFPGPDPHGCNYTAYVRRGRANLPVNFGGGSFNCANEWECQSLVYDCVGRPLSAHIVSGNLEFFHDPACEDAYNQIITIYQNTFSDFSKCEHGTIGWPMLCIPSYADQSGIEGCGLPACTPFPNGSQHEVRPNCADTVFAGDGVSSNGESDLFMNKSGKLCDVRTDASKIIGCSPCEVMSGRDIIVTVTDAFGNSVPVIVHVN